MKSSSLTSARMQKGTKMRNAHTGFLPGFPGEASGRATLVTFLGRCRAPHRAFTSSATRSSCAFAPFGPGPQHGTMGPWDWLHGAEYPPRSEASAGLASGSSGWDHANGSAGRSRTSWWCATYPSRANQAAPDTRHEPSHPRPPKCILWLPSTIYDESTASAVPTVTLSPRSSRSGPL